MKILYVAATVPEIKVLDNTRSVAGKEYYVHGDLTIYPLEAGVGTIATMWNMVQWIRKNGKPDFAINAGIAGSFNRNLNVGEVVMPVSECFADMGIEDNDRFITLFEAGLARADEFPFTNGFILSDGKISDQFSTTFKRVKSITVNTASGSNASIERLRDKYNADIETMEGASFFYICSQEGIPFAAVRSISNMIEPRNRSNWNIGLALHNLAVKLDEIFSTMKRI